ncbi:MAG TPA: hypothetical protein VHR84_18185 [Terriglobales bacterium]|jgi:hypothetical protein|nr:hypothetical protein [Terriglobales bacterium]
MNRFPVTLVCFLISTLPLNAQQTGADKHNNKSPEPLFQCGAGDRYAEVLPLEKYLEKGDSWGGVVGKVAICGGCDFADTPQHPTSNPPNHKTYAQIEWGDGAKSDLQLWLPDGQLAATTPHRYTSVIDPAKPVKLTMHAWCVNMQRNWEETITSTCDVTTQECKKMPAEVAVYENIAPSQPQVVQPVKHGQIAYSALSVVLKKEAPRSGTKVTLTSDNDLVTFRTGDIRNISKVKTKTGTIPAGHSAYNFDIDATAAKKPIKGVKITVSNAGGPPVETTFDVE